MPVLRALDAPRKKMSKFLCFVILSLAFSSAFSNSCPVSKPNLENPNGALKAQGQFGWFGTEELAAIIPLDGNWIGMGGAHAYRNKFWWWYEGSEKDFLYNPPLEIVAKNLERELEFSVRSPTGASTGSDNYQWYSLVTILEFPAKGCWQIVGTRGQKTITINLMVGE